MEKSYDFSVVMATYNRCEYLKQAIESVLAQKESTQLIVVDDASTDNTFEMMQEYKQKYDNIVYLRNDVNMFAHKTRSRGYKAAVGKYVVFMDDDDFYTDDNFFTKVKDVFERYNNVAAVFGNTAIYANGQMGDSVNLGGEGVIENKDYVNGFYQKYTKPYSTLTAVYRKSGLDEVKLSRSTMINDTCIYLYGILCGDVYLMTETVAAYRIHSTNISHSKFKFDFIFGVLNEKITTYKQAKKRKLLYDPVHWLYYQLKVSILYFIDSSGRNWKYILSIYAWLLFRGQGAQFVFLKRAIKSKLKK